MNRLTLTNMTASCLVAALVVVACSDESEFGPGGGRGGGGASNNDVKTGKNGGADGEPTATGLPCNVDAVLKSRCQTCHSSEPKYGANTSLVTWDDLQKAGPGASSGKKVFELVKERIANDPRPMPPSPNPRLNENESKTVDGWISGGAKASTDRCTNDRPSDEVKPLSCKADVVLKASKPYVMKASDPLDQYMCFGIDRTHTEKRHVIGLAPKVDNKKILHHILLFPSSLG